MVEHAPWRADDDVRAFFEGFNLSVIAYAAINSHGTQTCIANQLFGFLPHLAGQFAGGYQDQRLAVIYWFKTGDMLTGNYFTNAWQWAKNQLSFGTATSAMVKVETPVGSQGEDAAFGLLEDFASKLTPVLLDNIR